MTADMKEGKEDRPVRCPHGWINVVDCEPCQTRQKYDALLYAVARKFPGESRHETALRYIQSAESAVSAGDTATDGHNAISTPKKVHNTE